MEAAVVLFNRDLRLSDHPALDAAVTTAKRIVPLFVPDDTILQRAAPNRVQSCSTASTISAPPFVIAAVT